MRIVRYIQPNIRSLAPAFGAFARSPWAGLESEIDRLFESTLSNLAGGQTGDRFPVDVYEDKDNTYIRAELPGVDRAEINVEMVDDYLSINAARKVKDGEREESFSLSRSINIPSLVQADKVAAVYENGVLTVTLPKREESKPRKINVAVN